MEWNKWKNPQFKFSSQNLSIELNFFKWDGKKTKILHLLFHRIWKKLFTCENCGKLLTTKSRLESHIKAIHEGLKPFSCSTYCNKRFGTNGNLKNHEVVIHTGEFPHQCSLCNKGFTRKQALFSHIQQNHRIESKKKILWKIIYILKNFFAVNLL